MRDRVPTTGRGPAMAGVPVTTSNHNSTKVIMVSSSSSARMSEMMDVNEREHGATSYQDCTEIGVMLLE